MTAPDARWTPRDRPRDLHDRRGLGRRGPAGRLGARGRRDRRRGARHAVGGALAPRRRGPRRPARARGRHARPGRRAAAHPSAPRGEHRRPAGAPDAVAPADDRGRRRHGAHREGHPGGGRAPRHAAVVGGPAAPGVVVGARPRGVAPGRPRRALGDPLHLARPARPARRSARGRAPARRSRPAARRRRRRRGHRAGRRRPRRRRHRLGHRDAVGQRGRRGARRRPRPADPRPLAAPPGGARALRRRPRGPSRLVPAAHERPGRQGGARRTGHRRRSRCPCCPRRTRCRASCR